MQNLAVSHIIILKDKDKTHEIAQCTLKDDKLFVRFKNSSKTFSYKKPHFKLFAKATTSSVFAYFKTLAHTIGIKSDTSTQSLPLLAKEYDKITYISEDCVLFSYLYPKPPLNLSKIQITPPKQSPHNTTKQARYSLPLDSISPNTKPCKTPSLIK